MVLMHAAVIVASVALSSAVCTARAVDSADVTRVRRLSCLLRRVYNCLVDQLGLLCFSLGFDIESRSCRRDFLASRGHTRFLEMSSVLRSWYAVEDSIYRFLIFVRKSRVSIYGVFASPWHRRFFCSTFESARAGLIEFIWV